MNYNLSGHTFVGSQMLAISTSAVAPPHERQVPTTDDILSICAISIVAGILTNVLHEGAGHGSLLY